MKFFVARENAVDFTSNYTVDPNNIVAQFNIEQEDKQIMLGMIVSTGESCRFYFTESSIGNGISSRSNATYMKHIMAYNLNTLTNPVSLNEILEDMGCLVDDKEKCDIDLSPEALEIDTIINMIK